MENRSEVIARITAPGQLFEIRHETVLGRSLQVYANREISLGNILSDSIKYGNRPYLVTDDSCISFLQHYRYVAALATLLQRDYGVQKGDRVALSGANCPQWIIAYWAIVSIGAIAVGMNSMWTKPEIEYAVGETSPSLIIADSDRRNKFRDVELRMISMEDLLDTHCAKFLGSPIPEVVLREDDPAVILFTSGTTGHPKGVTHSHRNLIAAIWFHRLNDKIASVLGSSISSRRHLLATPLFHIAGLHNLAVVRLAVGDTAVIHVGRFDIDRVLRLIEKERVTNWGAVPTMLTRLVEADTSIYNLSSLRSVSVGSAPSTVVLMNKVRSLLPFVAFGTTYGLTESSTAATMATPNELLAEPTVVGTPVPTMQVEIRNQNGDRQPDGTEGEICLRGAQMMLGYWDKSTSTYSSSPMGDWFKTGDIGVELNGHIHILSRRSDLILRGGENVYPAEVEEQILLHPGVRECFVAGIDDPDMGQEVGAVVVAYPNITITRDELIEHARKFLAKYKIPRVLSIVETPLTRNATGKVNRAKAMLILNRENT